MYADLPCYNTSFMNILKDKYSNIDYYYPHPRDNEEIFCEKVIDDFRISEAKLIDLRFEARNVHVIGFPSTTILHLKDVPGFTFDVFFVDNINFDYSILAGDNVRIIDFSGNEIYEYF